jgi:hypothetical protein
MKLLITIYFILFTTKLFSYEGVVSVYLAPIFLKPNLKSNVIQYVKKGTRLFINKNTTKNLHNFTNNFISENSKEDIQTYSPETEVRKEIESLKNLNNSNKTIQLVEDQPDNFYVILDNNANLRYIYKKHVFVYTKTTDEYNNILLKKDNTDYRVPEPLPENFPNHLKTAYAASFNIGIVSNFHYKYPYTRNISKKELQTPFSFNIAIAKYFKIKKTQRLSLGPQLSFLTTTNSYTFFDLFKATEQFYLIGLGPKLNYDFFHFDNYIYSVGGGSHFNLYINIINQTFSTGSEKRTFSKFYIKPFIEHSIRIQDIIPNCDLLFTHLVNINLPMKYSSNTEIINSSLWQSDTNKDYYQNKFNLSQALYMGIISSN